MKASFLFLVFPLFMLQNVLAVNTKYWTQRYNGQSMFKYDLKAILRALSIDELVDMIERVRVLELGTKLEEEKQKRLRDEERMKKEQVILNQNCLILVQIFLKSVYLRFLNATGSRNLHFFII